MPRLTRAVPVSGVDAEAVSGVLEGVVDKV
jgi:hypothetical protein